MNSALVPLKVVNQCYFSDLKKRARVGFRIMLGLGHICKHYFSAFEICEGEVF